MTLLRDVVELQAIFGKIAFMATLFRERISNWISSWKSRFPPDEPDEDEEEDEEIEALVTRIGNLRISRTNSLRFSQQPAPPTVGALSTSQPTELHRPDARGQELTVVTTDPLPAQKIPEARGPGPRDPSTSHSTSKDPRPSSSPVTAKLHDFGSATYEATLQDRKKRSERPRSFDVRAFEGVKFEFDALPQRSKDDGHLTLPRSQARVFSAHDLDGEPFSFALKTDELAIPPRTSS